MEDVNKNASTASVITASLVKAITKIAFSRQANLMLESFASDRTWPLGGGLPHSGPRCPSYRFAQPSAGRPAIPLEDDDDPGGGYNGFSCDRPA